jgi:hypothetical protein|tara:strand:- start:6 stop:614 length:609 start_codon:yes stop_codon:yes gene_type:complete
MALNFANNNSLSAITSLPASISGGALTLLQTQTASSSSSIDFTSNIDSTYDSYVFKFINIHPATDGAKFTFQADTGTNTNYNQTITSTFFHASHNESDSDAGPVEYETGHDQAQGTGFQDLIRNVGSDNDQNCNGFLQIFNPSSSTFVKHFISTMNAQALNEYTDNTYIAGYFNTTTALTRFRFKMSSGNIDSGVIKLYGIS